MRTLAYHSLGRSQRIIVVFTVIVGMPFFALASRPFVTEDAGVAAKGVFQLELSWDHMKWPNSDIESNVMIVPIIGISDEVELSIEAPFLSHSHRDGRHHAGVGDLSVVTKMLLVNGTETIPAFVLKTAVKTPTSGAGTDFGSGAIDYGVAAVASQQMSDLILHGMIGYTLTGRNNDSNLRNTVSWGVAAEYCVSGGLHFLGEFTRCTNPDRTTDHHPSSAMAGMTLAISNQLVIDSSTRFGLTAAVPDWNTSLGITVSF